VATVVVVVVASTGGTAAVAVAGYLGASAATAATAGTVVSTTITAAAAFYGGYQTGRTIAEAVTGREAYSGRTLTDEEQSEKAGEAVVGVAAIACGPKLGKILRGRTAPREADQALIDELINTRRDTPGMSRDATLGIGRSDAGVVTPVRPSIPGPPDAAGELTPSLPQGHAEPQVVNDLSGRPGPHTVAVDQIPCDICNPMLGRSLPPGSRVIVPENPLAPPGGSPKTAALRAAAGRGAVQPRTVMETPQRETPLLPVPLQPCDKRRQ
jgi:hypothetical protein